MSENTLLLLYVIIWIFVYIVIFHKTYKSDWETTGLTLTYLSALYLIHFFGAIIYLLPWYDSKNVYGFYETFHGFEIATIGIISLFVSFVIISPFVAKKLNIKKNNQHSYHDLNKNFITNSHYLLIFGVVFYLFLYPRFGHIPSISAIVSSGRMVIVVALCALSFYYLTNRRYKNLLIILLISFSFPFLTIFALGYIGYGTIMSLILLIFISKFYKIKIKETFILIFVFYMALSVYQTYMRDRLELRSVIWGNASLDVKLSTFYGTFSNFELFNPFNNDQLDRIDDRLNQNHLVGSAVYYLQRSDDYARGSTLWDSVLAMVPRIIWKNKPIKAGSPEVVGKFTGIKFSESTSVGVGQVLELYINFAKLGVALGFIILGMIVYFLDKYSYYYLFSGNLKYFSMVFIVGLSILQVEGSFIELTSSALAGLILVFGVSSIEKSYIKLAVLILFSLLLLLVIQEYYLPIIYPIYYYVRIILAFIIVSSLGLLILKRKRRVNRF